MRFVTRYTTLIVCLSVVLEFFLVASSQILFQVFANKIKQNSICFCQVNCMSSTPPSATVIELAKCVPLKPKDLHWASYRNAKSASNLYLSDYPTHFHTHLKYYSSYWQMFCFYPYHKKARINEGQRKVSLQHVQPSTKSKRCIMAHWLKGYPLLM